MSGGREAAHVAADFGEDDASTQLVDAGNGGQELDRGAKGLDLSVDLLIDLSDGGVNRVDMLEEKALHEPMMVGHPTAQRCSSSAGLALIRRWANAANASGSVLPAIKASIIRRPDRPMMSEVTESSLMLASSSVFCSRWT